MIVLPTRSPLRKGVAYIEIAKLGKIIRIKKRLQKYLMFMAVIL